MSFSVSALTNSSGRAVQQAPARPPARRSTLPSGSSLAASIGAPASSSRQRPTASKCSSAKPIGSIFAWQPAHAGFARWRIIASRIVSGAPSLASSVASDGTSGGGGGGGDASRLSSTYLPRSTGDVRAAYDVTVRMLPWPEQAAARGCRRRARRGGNSCPGRSGCRSACASRSLTNVCFAVKQLEDAAAAAQHAVDEQLRLALERGAQRDVVIGEQEDVGVFRPRRRARTATAPRSS